VQAGAQISLLHKPAKAQALQYLGLL